MIRLKLREKYFLGVLLLLGSACYGSVRVEQAENLSIDTVFIPAGTFLMGSPDTEPGRYPMREKQHKVILTQDFYMSRYEITNGQFSEFLNTEGVGSDGKKVTAGNGEQTLIYPHAWGVRYDETTGRWSPQEGYDHFPVVNVTWYGADEFARWVGGALPTEAQWEYACRGGQTMSKPFGIGDGTKLTGGMANYYVRYSYRSADGEYTDDAGHETYYGDKTRKVGSYPDMNAYGLSDMHGNVSEWCADWYHTNYGAADLSRTQTDPPGPERGNSRILRGGSWLSYAQYCRSAYRGLSVPGNFNSIFGFRVVFVR